MAYRDYDHLERYPLGTLPEANIEILEYLENRPVGFVHRIRSDQVRVWRYRVKARCCGKIFELSHPAVRRRIMRSDEYARCRDCSNRATAQKPETEKRRKRARPLSSRDTALPVWPAPPSVVAGEVGNKLR